MITVRCPHDPDDAAGLPGEAVRGAAGLASAVVLWASAYHLAVRG
ncbi:hypothetical protein [Streptomyces nitrosporeus]|nr:hypothetical protein [Streptomyces nitrosporeus]